MTKLTKREFFDEYDQYFRAREMLQKPRYAKSFRFLSSFFNHKKGKAITRMQFQFELGLLDRSEAYQQIEGFWIVGFLEKLKKGKLVYYIPINDELWEYAKKEIEKIDGGKQDG